MLTTQSIEKALALTGNNIGMIEEWVWIKSLSIEKFCYYLLSPEFIEKYAIHIKAEEDFEGISWHIRISWHIWYCISEYQRRDQEFPNWKEQPLQNLLSIIS